MDCDSWADGWMGSKCVHYRVAISQPIIPFYVILSSSGNMEPFKTHNTCIKCERRSYLSIIKA